MLKPNLQTAFSTLEEDLYDGFGRYGFRGDNLVDPTVNALKKACIALEQHQDLPHLKTVETALNKCEKEEKSHFNYGKIKNDIQQFRQILMQGEKTKDVRKNRP